jgi:hypothetical protein
VRMTDHEMLLLLYGALKTKEETPPGSFARIVRMVEDHLWPNAGNGGVVPASSDWANRVKSFRKNKGFSQAELGIRFGVSDTTIGSWENGASAPKDEDQQQYESIMRAIQG